MKQQLLCELNSNIIGEKFGGEKSYRVDFLSMDADKLQSKLRQKIFSDAWKMDHNSDIGGQHKDGFEKIGES